LVFGGPYSNLRAVAALRARAAALRIDAQRTICTGDIVAYCAEPRQTVAAIRAWGCHVVAGNCEQQLARNADDCGCGFAENSTCQQLSKGWYPFARSRISAADRRWMAELPSSLAFALGATTFRVIHGGVARSNRFLFASQEALLAEELGDAGADMVIAGHAGLPFIAQIRGNVWFNPGVIGMPANDGTPDGWYGLIEQRDGALLLSTRRLAYDHRRAAAAMRRTGHADGYAEALLSGLWPSLDVLPQQEKGATGVAIAERRLRLPLPRQRWARSGQLA
jgi:predicted phosphodiesterase